MKENFIYDKIALGDFMKKNISIILIVAILLTTVLTACTIKKVDTPTNTTESTTNQNDNAITEEESLSDRLIREIDGSLQKEDHAMMTTYEQGQVYVDYAKKWEYVADTCYNALMKYESEDMEPYPTNEEFHTAIKNMKTDWENYYKSNMEDYRTTVYYSFGAGTGAVIVICKHEYQLKMEWALQLVEICERTFYGEFDIVLE